MKICVIQPSYDGSSCDYQHYDPPRDLSALLPGHDVHHVFVKKVSTFSQIQALARQRFDVFVNLCEGYRDSDVPSIDVIQALEHFDVAFTGPTSALYDPPKDLMKRVARWAGADTPAWVVADDESGVVDALTHLRFPMFVKPSGYGDSMGVDERALVRDETALRAQVAAVTREYGRVLIEEYIEGRELTVLVCAGPDPSARPRTFRPVEFLFPEGQPYKTYDLKVTQFHPESNVPCADAALATRLEDAAAAIFRAFSAVGYARMDFRVDRAGRICFLEVNFTCSVFYPEGYQGSADYILEYDGLGQRGFLQLILDEALARHARRRPAYTVRPLNGSHALFAARPLRSGDIVFEGEARPQRIVTQAHVDRHWTAADREEFYRYAYPIGSDVFVLWDLDPAGWAPQNHSCEPNTAFRGLNVVALRDIPTGEELTLDYATCYDARMIPFDCTCGAAACRGRIVGGRGLFGRDQGRGERG